MKKGVFVSTTIANYTYFLVIRLSKCNINIKKS